MSNIFDKNDDVQYAEAQRRILSNYFISENGKVGWQHEYVQRGLYVDE